MKTSHKSDELKKNWKGGVHKSGTYVQDILVEHVYRFNSAIFLYLSQARTISNVICRGLFFLLFPELRWEVIIRGIVTTVYTFFS